jgi:ribonuclease VapC
VILDTSALAAIFYGEAEQEAFTALIAGAETCRISAANVLELHMVLRGQLGDEAVAGMDRFLQAAAIRVEPVTPDQLQAARAAFDTYGKGRHPAGLNFGDCFAYALARTTGLPLLFKGADFARTDIPRAVG